LRGGQVNFGSQQGIPCREGGRSKLLARAAHPDVLGEYVKDQTVQTFLAGDLRPPAQQFGAQAEVLAAIGDDDRELGGIGTVDFDEAAELEAARREAVVSGPLAVASQADGALLRRGSIATSEASRPPSWASDIAP
jgi:hypothetical protein